MSIQDIAIEYLNNRLNNQVVVSGWGAALYRNARIATGFHVDGWTDWFSYRPDGYARLAAGGLAWLIAVEVEDTHPLKREKLRAYGELWFDFDSTDSHNL